MTEVEVDASSTFIPQRVRYAFDGAKDFGQFRARRSFVYLHLFSGGEDMIAKHLVNFGEKEGLGVLTVSVDQLVDKSMDLLADEPYGCMIRGAAAHDFDGAHAGFPCGSFSTARLNAGKGPPPVRSLDHMYGLPGNSRSQQAEADRGTVLAVRAATLVKTVLDSQRSRRTPQVGTLENPPGSETKAEGPAWELPELREFLQGYKAVTAIYNTCAFMGKEKTKWFKPGRLSGCLDGLEKLARKCSCPGWMKHEPLVGKEMTAKAAKYPDALAEEIAKLVIDAWKLTLQLEYWRLMLESKKEQVSSLQLKWLQSKEKKQTGEKGRAGMLEASKRVWYGTNVKDDQTPLQQPSKKARREAENELFIGGMRNPGKSIQKLTRIQEAGRDVGRLWDRFLKEHPEALEIARSYGSADCQFNETVLKAWAKNLEFFLPTKEFEECVVKEPWEYTSPLNAKLCDAWLRYAGDPEGDLVRWIRDGCPLGMSVEIPSSGIYPSTDENNDEVEAAEEIVNQLDLDNYKSFTEDLEQAEAEIQRYVDRGFCLRLSSEEITNMFERGTMSRLALIVKQKEDGSLKRRVIIDLLRSGGNRRCHVPERIVLPRAVDVVEGARFLWHKRPQLAEQALREGWAKTAEEAQTWSMEAWSGDLADAYCHLGVHRSELCHCLAPSTRRGEHLLFRALLFGFRGAPLIMGRLSGALARLLQALGGVHETQCQMYMDDPLVLIQGSQERIHRTMALLWYTAGALGVQFSFKKGSKGTHVVWIGIRFEIFLATKIIALTVPKKMMEEVQALLRDWGGKGMIALRELRSCTGKLSWIAGVLPRTRWCVSILYAVIADCLRAQREGDHRGRSSKDPRDKHGLVHVKRIELRIFKELDPITVRSEPFEPEPASLGIITDASPRGIGAVLFDVDEQTGNLTALAAVEAEVTPEDAKWLGIPWNDPAGQGPLEGWAVLLAIKKWSSQLEARSIILKSDSVVALAMASKGSSKSPVLNWIGAELCIRAERLRLGRIIGQHVPGAWNIEADWLSRPHERGEMPARLREVPIKKLSEEHKRRCFVDPPGVLPTVWGASSECVSHAFEAL